MARALLIANPVAARTTPATRDAVRAVLERAGWRADLVSTESPGDARRLAAQGVAAGVDVVAVFGGDGTTTQAASALVGTGVALGLIPGGTGNVLAGNLRIPRSPLRAAEALIHGRPRRIDLGEVAVDGVRHCFAVACGAGIDARVMGQTPSRDKRRWSIGAYMATALRMLPEVRSTPCTVTVDGTARDVRAALVLILNCREIIPPVVKIRNDAALDDGLLDLVVVTADSAWECLRALWSVMRNAGRPLRELPGLTFARGATIAVAAAEPMPMQYDGDPSGATPFTVRVLPGALAVMVPVP